MLTKLVAVVGLAFGIFAIVVIAPRDALTRTHKDLAERLLLGGTFTGARWSLIEQAAADIERLSAPGVWSGRLLIAVRAREFAIDEATPGANVRARYDALVAAARAQIERFPDDGLAWFALGYHQLRVVGASPSAYAALARSYVTVPGEWWLMRMRSPALLPILSDLRMPLRQQVFVEYARLLGDGRLAENVETFRMLDPATRQMVMPLIMELDERQREHFNAALRQAGDPQVIPLERHSNPRPWHRD